MGDNRPSRHVRLYNEGRQLLHRKSLQALKAADDNVMKSLDACSFRPFIKQYRNPGISISPKGVSSVVSRLRAATEQRQTKNDMLTPRVPMKSITLKQSLLGSNNLASSVLVEVVRDGLGPDIEYENLGRFRIDSRSDPANVARCFGSDYGLTPHQTSRLETKLRISMQTLFEL
jgi:hypothetical protein